MNQAAQGGFANSRVEVGRGARSIEAQRWIYGRTGCESRGSASSEREKNDICDEFHVVEEHVLGCSAKETMEGPFPALRLTHKSRFNKTLRAV